VLEGIKHGPYSEQATSNHRTPFPDDTIVVVGADRKLFVAGQLMHHGSLWTKKSHNTRHRQHLMNCVLDSQAWQQKTVNMTVEAAVDSIEERFGSQNMYVRNHSRHLQKRSVKVFRDRNGPMCKQCQHCNAYRFLNELLGCAAPHGPWSGWDHLVPDVRSRAVASARALVIEDGQGMSPRSVAVAANRVIPETHQDRAIAALILEAVEPPHSWESLAMTDGEAAPLDSEGQTDQHGCVVKEGSKQQANTDRGHVFWEEQKRNRGERSMTKNTSVDTFSISLLAFNSYGRVLDEAILHTELAVDLQINGLDTKPAWAHGAKVLFQTRASALPENLQLRPYHVLLKTADIPTIDEALLSLPYKHRPRCTTSQEVLLDFLVEKTFIVVAEPCDELAITPRSMLTVSTGAMQKGYKNPRSFEWAGCEFASSTDAVSQSHLPHQSKTFVEHMEDLKGFQVRSDYARALQSFSNMKRDGLQPDTQAFSIIIEMCGKVATCEEVEMLMQKMIDERVPPSLITFNCVINSLARRGFGKRAEMWLERMAEFGFQPSLVTYNCVIKAYANQGLVDMAMKWVETAKCKCEPNMFTLAPIISYFARKGLPEQVEELLVQATGGFKSFKALDFDMLLSAHANARNLEGVARCCRHMKESGIPLQVYQFSQCLKACCPSGNLGFARNNIDDAIAFFHDQIRAGIKPDYFNIAILECALGHERSHQLCEQFGVDVAAIEREHDATKDELGLSRWDARKMNKDGTFRRNPFNKEDYKA